MNDAVRLDGNASGGLLSEIFQRDVTATLIACRGCGAVGEVARQHLYIAPLAPGGVLRCSGCDAVLLVVVRREDRYRLAFDSTAWFDVPRSTDGGTTSG